MPRNVGAPPAASREKGDDSAVRLAGGAAITVAGGFAARGLQFLTQVVLANVLAPALLGLFAEGFALFRLARLAAVAGLDKGIIRFGTQLWDAYDDGLRYLVRRAFAFSGVLGLAIGSGLWLTAPWIAERVMGNAGLAPVLRAFALTVPSAAVVRLVAATTRLGRRAHWAVVCEDLIQPTLGLALVVVLLGWGYGLRAALVAWPLAFALAAAVGVVLVLRLLPQHLGRASGPRPVGTVSWRSLLGFSFNASLAVSFTMMTMMIDRLMIGMFRPEEEVGTYHAAAQVAALFPMVVGAFGAMLQPMIVACWRRGDSERLRQLFRAATRWGLYLAIPAYVVIARSAPSILETLFQPAYRTGAWVLVILASGQMINAATGPVGQLLVMGGREGIWAVCSGSALVANVCLDLVLIPRFGAVGAAVATAFAIALTFGLGLLIAAKSMRLMPYAGKDLGLIIAGIVAALAVMGRQAAWPLPGLAGLLGDAGIAVAVVGLTVAAVGFDSEERLLFGSVLERITRVRRKPDA